MMPKAWQFLAAGLLAGVGKAVEDTAIAEGKTKRVAMLRKMETEARKGLAQDKRTFEEKQAGDERAFKKTEAGLERTAKVTAAKTKSKQASGMLSNTKTIQDSRGAYSHLFAARPTTPVLGPHVHQIAGPP